MAKLPALRKKDTTPTRQVTGTSYSSDGAVELKPADYQELGSQRKIALVDPVPELSNRTQAVRTYTKMARTDVSVRTSLRAGKSPVLGADYYFDAYDDTPDSQAINEFVEYNLFEGMTTPWLKTVEQICKFMENGFQTLEPVWELREWAPKKTSSTANRRKYTMLRKLAVRPADTILRIDYDDNGGPTQVVQNAIDANGKANQVPIPIDKLVIFTFDQDGGDLMGTPILRPAYEHWFYKYHLYKIDAIQKERHALGVPRAKLLPGWNDNDKKIAFELTTNLRTNEKAGIVITDRVELDFMKVEGQLVNVMASAEHHDNMIMKNIMVQFLNLGINNESGGRATGATAMDMFLKAMRYIAQSICDAINMYLIPQLVAYNFKTDQFPKLCVRNIGETKDLQMWAAAMANLVDKGLITMDDESEAWARKQVQMPGKLGPRPKPTFEPHDIRELIQTKGGNGTGGGGMGTTTGNVGKSPSSAVT